MVLLKKYLKIEKESKIVYYTNKFLGINAIIVSSSGYLSARPEHDGARRGRAKIQKNFMRD